MTSTLPLQADCPPTATRPEGRWLSVVSHTDPRYGGLSSAVPRMAEAVTGTGRFEVSLAAFCNPGERFTPGGLDEAHLRFWPAARRPWLQSGALRAQFLEQLRAVDGVHIHGLWEASTAVAGRSARALGKPYLLSAHGMLEPWALANKRLKKQLYAFLLERGIVANATCLHALTVAEAEQYRAFGARGPIAVIPNAVEVPTERSPELFLEQFPQLRGKRLLLYLGRLHPKKGLNLLVDAWAKLSHTCPEAHLVLAGPDAEGTAARLAAGIAAAGIEASVTFAGMLGQERKWSALAAAQAFVLPSFSEGLSMSVLEAMGAGLPVLVTRACNMPEVTTLGAGWEFEANTRDLTKALEDFLSKTPEQNRHTGSRGAELITNRYNPRHVARQMADLYSFVQSGIQPKQIQLLTL